MESRRDIQRERLFYIEFLAVFTGKVSRKDLVNRFGISEAAATKDLSLYGETAPGVLTYDLKQKCYVLAGSRYYFTHSVDQALHSLVGERAIAIEAGHAERLDGWVNASIKRSMPLDIVAAITRCMFQKKTMNAEYTSHSSGDKPRLLTPLALINDGLRWHIRCFNHSEDEFRDYNLARFTKVSEGDLSDASLEADDQWNQYVCLDLAPHPNSKHPETARLDYGITGECKQVKLRSCLVGYFLRFWPIDFSDDASANPKAKQLFLVNKAELLRQGVSEWALSYDS